MSENNNKTEHPLKDEQQANEAILSKNDTMKVLTPFAFKIDQSLFGLSLATPSRRLIALCIDLFLVALLSDAPGELLAIFLAITFYRVSKVKFDNSLQAQADGRAIKGRKRKKFARWLSAFFLFIALINILPALIDPINQTEQVAETSNSEPVLQNDEELSIEQAIALTATTGVIIETMHDNACETLTCWQEVLPKQLSLLDGIPFKQKVLTELYEELADNTALSEDEQRQLAGFLVEYHQQHLLPPEQETVQKQSEAIETNDIALASEINIDENNELANEKAPQVVDVEPSETKKSKPVYSIVKYIEGLIQDLGLGFGWAAFYFTVFTSAWHGQTPGKKLLGIRVIQLDGTPLSLWDSFGRYGGYGAGIATGMLGFLQVFWDANRQAIHDKISATVVIDHERKSTSVSTVDNATKNEA